jgi:sigma-54 specific flagellar transcriptional regulator A
MPVLIDNLLERQARSSGRIRIANDAMNCLMRCRWPGNVRELGNLLERLGILYPDQVIGATDLPERYRIVDSADWFGTGMHIEAQSAPISSPAPAPIQAPTDSLPSGGLDLKDHLSTIELGLIRKAMQEADGTVAEAARLLRMRRTTLVEKLRKYRLHA